MTRRANLFLLLSLSSVGACDPETGRPPGPPDPVEQGDEGSSTTTDGLPDDGRVSAARECRTASTGCPCDERRDAPVECHSDSPVEDEHGRLRCLVGDRACEDGVWGSCVYSSEYDVSMPGERAFADAPALCLINCDPLCWFISDDYVADPGPLVGSGVAWSGVAGGIILSATGSVLSGDYAWIGLEATSEVTRIRTSDGAQVGRYLVGEAGVTAYPSRSAVDTLGDAYIAGRGIDGGGDYHGFDGGGFWGSLTRVAGDPLRCNNAPTPTTSTDDVALPIGTDDCVLWNVRVGTVQGSHPNGIAIDRGDAMAPAGRPWVGTTQNVDGGNDPGRAYQFDTDGTLIQSIPLPIHVFAAAADAQTPQHIWFSSYWTGRLASVRVSDGLVEGPFAPPIPNCTGDPTASAYGMAVDSAGRIWRGSGGGCNDWMTGYDPQTDSWCLADPGRRTGGVAIGLNPDGSNTVWAVSLMDSHRLLSFDPDIACVDQSYSDSFCDDWPDDLILSRFNRDYGCDGSSSVTIGIPTYDPSNITDDHIHSCTSGDCPRGFLGVDLDSSNRVLIVDPFNPGLGVFVIPYDPATGTWLPEYPTTGAFPTPHALSDFTGYQRNSFTLQGTGEFHRDYGVLDPACPPASTPVWGDLSWTAVTVNSRIDFYATVTDDPATLPTAPRVLIGSSLDASPIFIHSQLPIPVRFGRYIRITAAMVSLDGLTSPVLASMFLDWNCNESE
jgi:hypothetical protein